MGAVSTSSVAAGAPLLSVVFVKCVAVEVVYPSGCRS